MIAPFIRACLAAAVLAGCGNAADSAQVIADRPPYLDLCRATNGDLILFDSRLKGGRMSAAFYRVGGSNQLQKLAHFAAVQVANNPRSADDPPEATHHMAQWGANMEGDKIINGYRVTMPMRTVQIGEQTGQQMVGQDRLTMRVGGKKWDAVCDELDPRGSEYSAFLKELGQ